MQLMTASVNPSRRYDSTGRQRQAEQSRQLVLDSALELFVSDGYAATTVAAIADASGVSVETIYKAFGGKPGLIRALRERALIGDEPETTEQRSDRLRDAASDPRQIIEIWAGLST